MKKITNIDFDISDPNEIYFFVKKKIYKKKNVRTNINLYKKDKSRRAAAAASDFISFFYVYIFLTIFL